MKCLGYSTVSFAKSQPRLVGHGSGYDVDAIKATEGTNERSLWKWVRDDDDSAQGIREERYGWHTSSRNGWKGEESSIV